MYEKKKKNRKREGERKCCYYLKSPETKTMYANESITYINVMLLKG